ncbi:hypothetical protein [Reinekea sp.]|jgi:hypothetical protein|uniref:hypothetical protein n=1 Tax=Reinekea sp. TaxID=1970455 RepID=UPI003989A280
MSNEDKSTNEPTDDSLEYEKFQAKSVHEDPLAAVKELRLQQLAVCRVKAAEEIQTMTDKFEANKGDGSK